MKTGALQIRTVEGVVFSLLLAGPVIRFLAWLVDLACIMVLMTVFGLLTALLGMLSWNLAGALSAIGYFLISIGYGIACEWGWRGQTVGKRILGLRVVDAEGLRLQFNQVVTRNLLRFVDSLPATYLVGGLACWLSPKCQRLGDLAANTVVIRSPRVIEPDLDQLLAGKFNSLRQYPHLAARLRQSVSPVESAVALQALIRREALEPAERIALFADLTAHFRARTLFPPEAKDGISGEHNLRHVMEVLHCGPEV